MCGAREPEHASLADLPTPHTPPLQGLSPHILCPIHLLRFPLERGVTLTLGVTSCISYNNNQLHPQHITNPNSRCHLESTLQPLPSRGWKSHPLSGSAFICHAQVPPTVCPCEIAGRPPQRQPHPYRTFIKDLQNTPQVPSPPKRGLLWRWQPTHIFKMLCNMSYCSVWNMFTLF